MNKIEEHIRLAFDLVRFEPHEKSLDLARLEMKILRLIARMRLSPELRVVPKLSIAR